MASSESISNRLASARGVVRKERRTLVTRRLSTFVSEELRRRRRRASIRCSLIMTAGKTDQLLESTKCTGKYAPSCRSFPISRFFSLTSFSSSCVLEVFVCVSSRVIYDGLNLSD